MNKEIMINGEKWIVDYGRRVICNNVKVDTGMLPINASIEYPFCMFKDTIYFKKGNNAYKVAIGSDTAEVISKEELMEVYNGILKIVRPTDSYIELIVCSILIDRVFKDKYDINFSIANAIVNGRFQPLFYYIKNGFPVEVNAKIKVISRNIKALLPMHVDKSNLEENITNYLQTEFEQEDIDNLVNKIYESNISKFEKVISDIKGKRAK